MSCLLNWVSVAPAGLMASRIECSRDGFAWH
jgi:hypothetical protein